MLIVYPADWKFKKKVGPGPGVMNAGREMAHHACAERDTRDEFGPMNAGQGSTGGSGNSDGLMQMKQGGYASQILTTQPTFTPKSVQQDPTND